MKVTEKGQMRTSKEGFLFGDFFSFMKQTPEVLFCLVYAVVTLGKSL